MMVMIMMMVIITIIITITPIVIVIGIMTIIIVVIICLWIRERVVGLANPMKTEMKLPTEKIVEICRSHQHERKILVYVQYLSRPVVGI